MQWPDLAPRIQAQPIQEQAHQPGVRSHSKSPDLATNDSLPEESEAKLRHKENESTGEQMREKESPIAEIEAEARGPEIETTVPELETARVEEPPETFAKPEAPEKNASPQMPPEEDSGGSGTARPAEINAHDLMPDGIQELFDAGECCIIIKA